MEYLKHIHIGSLIYKAVKEQNILMSRVCNFFDLPEEDIIKMFTDKTISADLLLKWSKLLEYDFFRVYTAHLILYSPSASNKKKTTDSSELPSFKKNIYTQEVIDFILEIIETKRLTVHHIINEYNIPKTTIYRWIRKNTTP